MYEIVDKIDCQV